jgi:hypothetical protein
MPELETVSTIRAEEQRRTELVRMQAQIEAVRAALQAKEMRRQQIIRASQLHLKLSTVKGKTDAVSQARGAVLIQCLLEIPLELRNRGRRMYLLGTYGEVEGTRIALREGI